MSVVLRKVSCSVAMLEAGYVRSVVEGAKLRNVVKLRLQ